MFYNGQPKNYKEVKSDQGYFKSSEINKDTKIRIVNTGVQGFEEWGVLADGKKYVKRYITKPKVLTDPENTLKEFWAVYIWDYALQIPRIWIITQKSIRSALDSLFKDSDITTYDIKLKKEGNPPRLKYTLLPSSPSAVSKEVVDEVNNNPVNLDALYEGKNPWTSLEAEISSDNESGYPESNDSSIAQIIRSKIKIPANAVNLLDEFLSYARKKSPKPMDEMVDIWLSDVQKFFTSFGAWANKEKSLQLNLG